MTAKRGDAFPEVTAGQNALPFPQTSRSRGTMAETAHLFGLSLAQYGLAFIVTAVVSRILGPEGRGVYYLPVLTASTLVVFCRLGLDQANIFLLGTRQIPLRALAAQNTLVVIVMGTAGIAATAFLPLILPSMFRTTPLELLMLGSLMVPMNLWTQLGGGILSLVGQPAFQYTAGVIGTVGQGLVLAALAFHGTLTPGEALGAAVVGAALTSGVLAVRLGRLAPLRPRIDLPLLRDTLGHALILHLASLLLLLHLRVDMFMVSAWRGPAALGLYSISVVLGETLMLATQSVALALLPEQVRGSLRDAALRALDGVRAMAVIGTLLALAWVVLGRWLIRLAFGAEYVGAYDPLVVLLPGVVMFSLQRMCSAPTLRAGWPSAFLAIAGGSLLLNVSLNAIWIPRWGAVGASAASSVSYSLSSLLFLFWTTRIAEVRLRDLVDLRGFVTLAVAARGVMARTIAERRRS